MKRHKCKSEKYWWCPICEKVEGTSRHVEGLMHRHEPALPIGNSLVLLKEIPKPDNATPQQ